MKIAVIGAGMIGSAAARHLARGGHDTWLVGPSEPRNKSDHRGVFGSHYDAGRITRSIDPDPFWAQASADSIARYAEVEEQSGISFYTERGLLMAGPLRHAALQSAETVALQKGYPFNSLMAGALAVRFPYYSFASTSRALFEPTGAGFVDPRALVAAQIAAGQKAGATRVNDTVAGVSETQDAITLHLEDGADLQVDQVLVAAGGFSNMVLPDPVPLTVLARTILLAEVAESEAARLANLPPLILYFDDGSDMYLLPPIRYPNGRYYIKLGGDPKDVSLGSISDIKAWFRQGGDSFVGTYLDGILTSVMPHVDLGLRHLSACVTTFPAEGETQRPVLKRLSDRISVATAGCGRGAKCSDELGRLGAELAQGHELPAWVYLPRPKELSAH